MTRDPEQLWLIAMRLYPTSVYLQQEWLRAVDLVRCTQRGWVLDQHAARHMPPNVVALKERTA